MRRVLQTDLDAITNKAKAKRQWLNKPHSRQIAMSWVAILLIYIHEKHDVTF